MTVFATVSLAGSEGIEPSLAVLETAVLPLNDDPKLKLNYTLILSILINGPFEPIMPPGRTSKYKKEVKNGYETEKISKGYHTC